MRLLELERGVNCKGWFTLGPTKAESSQAEHGEVFTLGILFTLGCVGCSASEARLAARVYLVVWCKQAGICNDWPLQQKK